MSDLITSPDFGLALLGLGLLLFVSVIVWALCKAASDADDAAEAGQR